MVYVGDFSHSRKYLKAKDITPVFDVLGDFGDFFRTLRQNRPFLIISISSFRKQNSKKVTQNRVKRT